MKTDTPETNKISQWSDSHGWIVDIDFARRLERERDEAREACDTCDAYLLANEQLRIDLGKIKRQWDETRKERDRLAEALQDLIESCNCIDSVDFMPVSMPEAFEKAQQALQSLTLKEL
jgi:hypothetical protein